MADLRVPTVDAHAVFHVPERFAVAHGRRSLERFAAEAFGFVLGWESGRGENKRKVESSRVESSQVKSSRMQSIYKPTLWLQK